MSSAERGSIAIADTGPLPTRRTAAVGGVVRAGGAGGARGGGRMAEMAEEPPIVPKPMPAALPRVLPGALAALAPSGGV